MSVGCVGAKSTASHRADGYVLSEALALCGPGEAEAADARGGGRIVRQRVLLVAALSVWTQLLEDQVERLTNFEVVGSAPDGAAMLVEFERIQPPADIVVVDVSTRLALQTASALRRSHPTTKLIALGLDEDPGQAIAWAAAGAVGLLGRTASRDELLSALTDVARNEAYCSAAISGALLRGVGGNSGGVRPSGSGAPLTRREEEVARLVAGGFTNKEIAARLQVSPGTVKSHVHNIIRKLGVVRRAHVAGNLPQQATLPVLTAHCAHTADNARGGDGDQPNGIDESAVTIRQIAAGIVGSA
jgi:DNA-binding NarL/FixJ family response regulator